MSSRVCLIIYDLPVYISSCLFSLMLSGQLVIPGVSCLWVLPCPVMSCLDVLLNIIIWVYILVCVFLFLPRVCTVTEDQTKTVSGAHSPRFVFRFEKFLFCSSVCVCLSRGMEVAARHSRHDIKPSSQLRHGPQSSQLRHGPQSSQLHHGLQSSLHRHGFQSSQLRHGPCLSVLLWRSPSCVPVCVCPEGPPERPPPLPDGTVKARDEPFGRGELCQSSVVCHVSPPHASLFGLFFCPCLLSLLVNSCPAVFV